MFKNRWWVVKFIHRSLLWVFLVPLAFEYGGTALNEVVLARNGDRFPVMCSDARWFKRQQDLKLRLEKAVLANNIDDEFDAELHLSYMEHGFVDEVHVRMGQETHWNWLADWIDTKDATVSPGDVLIDIGEFFLQYIWYIWMVLMICQVHLLFYKLEKGNNGDNATST